MTLSFWVLCAAGFALHFLTRYRVAWKCNGKLSPLAFVCLDPIGWLCAAITTAVLPFILPELGPLIGMPVALTQFGGFACGYMGSSLAKKLPGLMPGGHMDARRDRARSDT